MPTASKRVTTLASLLALAFAVGALPAQASCAEAVPLSEAITNADTVFVGTVTELDFDSRVATFTVEEIWKGETGATSNVVGGSTLAELQTARATGQDVATSVDRSYQLGLTYLVVSHGSQDGVLLDNQCSNTQPFATSPNEYRPADVAPPSVAPPNAAPADPAPTAGNWTWAAISGSALALAAGIYVAAHLLDQRHRSRAQAF